MAPSLSSPPPTQPLLPEMVLLVSIVMPEASL